MPPTPETVEVGFISPRHLAGGGDPAWVTVPLVRACGWGHGNDPLMPRVLLSSLDQKALLRLEPVPDGQWWTLSHAPEPGRPAWYASFGGHTPPRLIAAFTTALADTRPVARTDSPRSLPILNPGLVTRRFTEVLAVLVASALEERVRSLAARHAVPAPAQRPARQAPSMNGHSR